MANVNFYLKNPKDQTKEVLIYLYFTYEGRRLKYSSGEKIAPKYWNKSSQKVSRSFTGGSDINRHLKSLEEKILSIYRSFRTQGEIPTPQELRNDLNKAFNKLPKNKLTFFDVFDEFVETTKPKVHKRTSQKYITLKNHLLAFRAKTNFNFKFEKIDVKFYDKFVLFCMNDLKLLNNSTGKYITTLKTFLNWATEREYNTNLKYKKFKVFKEDADIVYLEYEELMKLYEYDLTKNKRLEKVRDAFCLCCFSGMRFSDVKQLTPENIKGDFIILKIYKTKETLRIPLNSFAKSIIEKYIDKTGFLNVISNQKSNDYLKELCELAEINQPVTLTKFRGNHRIEITEPKFRLISTHTARRTFVTLSLEQGMRPEIVMQITGHKTYQSFKKYIKITDKVKDNEMKRVWDRKQGKNPLMRIS